MLLIDHIFNSQCEDQFRAFKRGFYKVISEDIMELFKPEELELLVCGSKVLDFKELEENARYVDGYTEHSEIISWLWDVIHNDMTDIQRKKFLFFTTGSDRAPVNGLGSLNLFVGRHGPDTERLPCAHTCFNHLLLAEYSSKDKLRIKLMTAIENAEGFGMI
jgi:ubiquitin-protein ligase E3 A